MNHMSFDVIQCFCNNSAWYQIHLYEPGKKLSQQKLFSSVQIGWGKKRKSTRVWQSLLASFQLKCCKVEKAYKFVTYFPERRKITL